MTGSRGDTTLDTKWSTAVRTCSWSRILHKDVKIRFSGMLWTGRSATCSTDRLKLELLGVLSRLFVPCYMTWNAAAFDRGLIHRLNWVFELKFWACCFRVDSTFEFLWIYRTAERELLLQNGWYRVNLQVLENPKNCYAGKIDWNYSQDTSIVRYVCFARAIWKLANCCHLLAFAVTNWYNLSRCFVNLKESLEKIVFRN